jgi:hypothetical protein
MTDYGPNFGWRRAGEEIIIREGRLSLPASGTFHQGDLVKRDTAADGFLAAAGNAEPAVVGGTGLLIQELGWDFSIYGESGITDSYNKGNVRLGRLSQMVSGQGAKFWLRNNAAVTNSDRTIAARTVVDVTGLALGNYLGWDGVKWVKQATAGPTQHAYVTKVSGAGASAYAEAVLQY